MARRSSKKSNVLVAEEVNAMIQTEEVKESTEIVTETAIDESKEEQQEEVKETAIEEVKEEVKDNGQETVEPSTEAKVIDLATAKVNATETVVEPKPVQENKVEVLPRKTKASLSKKLSNAVDMYRNYWYYVIETEKETVQFPNKKLTINYLMQCQDENISATLGFRDKEGKELVKGLEI